MAESIVKVPTTASGDFDFLAFSFNGKHSYDDFGIYRVSSGGRYDINLMPTLEEKTADSPSADGGYYFNTYHKQKVFNISFAFQDVDDKTIRKMKQWLNGKELADLWFEEEPYKIYTAKVTATPAIKVVSFNKTIGNISKRVYCGEGTVQFTCYWPYAHTPDKIVKYSEDIGDYVELGSGKFLESYRDFHSLELWREASQLFTEEMSVCMGENVGDLPAPFVLTISDAISITKGTQITFDDCTITINSDCNGLKWNSKTGIITTILNKGSQNQIEAILPCSGNTLHKIPIGGNSNIYYTVSSIRNVGDTVENIETTYYIDGLRVVKKNNQIIETGVHDTMLLEYHYWYY